MDRERKVSAYMVIPCLFLAIDHGSSKASSRINTSSGDRNGGQVNHEHGKSDWKWCQYLLIHIYMNKISKTQNNPSF